ncbi:MAG TPA: hypothetical protein VK822_00505 [Acetobacteraceae bacterium]|jgi:hypothetical protein|nr:hypothetical protein [Acetobacteraceae bacterium]
MYVKRLTGLSGEMSTVLVYPDPLNKAPVFMFGAFDLADGANLESVHALDEALLGIKEDGSLAVAIRSHTHAKAPADGSSSAFMFGVRPEQPSTAPVGELFLDLWAAELD